MKLRSDFILDEYGLPVTLARDNPSFKNGGDSIHDLCRYGVMLILRQRLGIKTQDWTPYKNIKEVLKVLSHCEKEKGVWVRHPDPGPESLDKKWNDPSDLSRDGTAPLICLLALIKTGDIRKDVLKELYNKMKHRLFFYQNKDLPSINLTNIMRLGLKMPLSCLAIYLSKQATKWGVKIECYDDKDTGDVADDLNLTCILLTLLFLSSDKIIDLNGCVKEAMLYYKHNLKPSKGETVLGEGHPVLARWRWYYENEEHTFNSPGIALLAEPVIKRLF